MKYLGIDTVFYIMIKAREFDVKVAPEGLERDSNSVDDGCIEILEDYSDDATEDELREALVNLNQDQLHELLALVWLGRGSYDKTQWNEAIQVARDTDPSAISTPAYLMGTPLLSDFIEEGLAELGLSLEEFEIGRL